MTKTLVENLKENLRTNTKETKGRILVGRFANFMLFIHYIFRSSWGTITIGWRIGCCAVGIRCFSNLTAIACSMLEGSKLKFWVAKLIIFSTNVVKHHQSMPYRKRGDQDLFSEFNFLSPHLAFSVHFCRVIKKFRINMAKEDEVLQKVQKAPQ